MAENEDFTIHLHFPKHDLDHEFKEQIAFLSTLAPYQREDMGASIAAFPSGKISEESLAFFAGCPKDVSQLFYNCSH